MKEPSVLGVRVVVVALTVASVVLIGACSGLVGPGISAPTESPIEQPSKSKPTAVSRPTAELEHEPETPSAITEVIGSFPFRRELHDEGLLHGEAALFTGRRE